MTRLTPEREQEIRKGAKTWKWHANEINELLTELDALRAENTELLHNAGDTIVTALDDNKKLRDRLEKLRVAISQVVSMVDDCPLIANTAKDMIESHCRSALAEDDKNETLIQNPEKIPGA